MNEKIELRELSFNVKYKVINPNLVVGYCQELPPIIARGKDVDELIEEVKFYLVDFINTFPDKMNDIILKYSKTIEEDDIQNSTNKEWIVKPLYA